jgi:hypothetical protein
VDLQLFSKIMDDYESDYFNPNEARQTSRKLQPEYLVKSFVDVGPTYTLLYSTDNQIMFSRRGNGKTHFLAIINNEITSRNVISVSIDMRLIGFIGGIFSDLNLPLIERATRLLSDTLCVIHEIILDYVLDKNLENTSDLVELLNDFIEQATALNIEGVSEDETGQSSQSGRTVSSKVGVSEKGVSADLSALDKTSSNNTSRSKTVGKKVLRIHFKTITKLLNKIVSKLTNKKLWILIDEWSETSLKLQPYLAELLRRILYPIRYYSEDCCNCS